MFWQPCLPKPYKTNCCGNLGCPHFSKKQSLWQAWLLKPYKNNRFGKPDCWNPVKTIVLASVIAETLQKQTFQQSCLPKLVFLQGFSNHNRQNNCFWKVWAMRLAKPVVCVRDEQSGSPKHLLLYGLSNQSCQNYCFCMASAFILVERIVFVRFI